MAKDVIITPADGDIQFENSSGTEAGKIEQSGNDLVLSNAVGDILIGDGTADVYIGDGSNNVDIVFEQNGSIRGEAGSSVDITLGSSDTDIIISGSTFNIDPDANFAGVVKADGNIALGNISGLARIQHEGSGQLKMLSSGDSHIATFTSTGTTFASDVTVSGDLLIGNTSQDPKKIIISQIGASTSENTSLMLDGNGVVVVRNLGSNAFNSTTIPTDHGDHAGLYLPIGGGTLTGDLHISNNAAPADDLTLLTLQNGNSTGDISTPNTFIDFEFKDSNTNVVPQARIGAHAGDGGDADSQVKEGKGYLTFHTSDTTATSGTVAPPERVRIAHNGNVGIGEINPSSKLEVGGEIDATGGDGYRIEGKPWANWGSDLLTLGDFDGEGYATRIMGSNSSEVMRVTGNNVGIGTILPASKLEVQTGYIISSGSGASDLGFVLDRAGLDTYQIRHLDGGLTIFNETDNRKEMTFLGNGNVGIGTTSPDHKLEIGLTSTVALAAQPAEPLHVSNNGLSVDGRVLISVKHTAINTASAIGAGLKMTAAAVTTGTPSYFDSLIYLESAGPGSDTIHSAPKAIKFYVDNHDTAAGDGTNYNQLGDLAMTIAESANVGIGTSTPDYKLEVSGTLGVSRLSGIIFGGSAGTGTGNKIYGDLVNNFYISTAAASAPYSSNTRFTILNSNGNVGIATTSPSEKLHVYNGTAYVTPVSYAANQDAYALKVGAYNNASFDMGLKVKSTSGGSPYLSFSTTSADDVLTMWQTKVGIGVANPETKLHIKGSSVTSFTGTGEHQFRIESDTTNNRYTGIGFSQASDRDIAKIAMKRTSAGSHLYFGTSNNYGNGITNEALVIDHSGNVGIGDTTPETALEVAGTSTTENLAFKKPTADNQFRGEIVTFGLQSGIAQGDIVAYNSSGQWVKAQANSGTTSKNLLGVAMGSTADAGILLRGFVRDSSFGNQTPSKGQHLYLSTSTSGDYQTAVPSTTGHIARIIGYSVDPAIEMIYFCPDNTFVEIA